jgi:integrase
MSENGSDQGDSGKRSRAAAKILESKTFKDGAIYLYRRADYKKPPWFIRLKVPGLKGYLWKSSQTTDEYAAYKAAEDFYNLSLGKVYAGVTVNTKRVALGIDAFIKHQEERPRTTAESYTISLAKRLKPLFRMETFDEFDTPMIGRMLEAISSSSRKGELSPNTIKRLHGYLRILFRWWVENGYVEKTPAFPKASTKKNRRPHFDARDWATLTRYMREFIKIDHAPVRRDRTLLVNYVLILANTGIRVGEARTLRWRDIRPVTNPEDPSAVGVALMVRGKTGTREVVARTGEVRKYFQRALELRMDDLDNPNSDIFGKGSVPLDGYVFCNEHGKPIHSFKKSFNSLIDKAGVTLDTYGERRTIYSLRHTYATFRLNEGVNHYVLARNMGTSVAMLEDYYGHTTNVGMIGELTKSNVSHRAGTKAKPKEKSALAWLTD